MLAPSTQASHPVIEISDLTIAFPGRRKQSPNVALRQIDLEVSEGDVCCLLGPSGCGKSTLLNVIAGVLQPTSGSVRYFGQVVGGVNTDVGYITQDDNLLPWRSVRRNVALGLEVAGVNRRERAARVEQALELVGLGGVDDVYPAQLSGGMKSRVSLARTLVLRPRTLLMDEPFAALDAQRRVLLQTELLRIQEATGVSVVFVTHDLDEAIVLADKIVVFEHGPAAGITAMHQVALAKPRRAAELRRDPTYAQLWAALWSELGER